MASLLSSTFLIVCTILPLVLCSPLPLKNNKSTNRQQPRQLADGQGLSYHINPDGSISGSFSFSEAINQPGATGSIGASQTFNIGPKGSSFGGSQGVSLNGNYPGGNNFGFSQSNSMNQNQGPNGFSSSGSNAASNSFSNPLFSSSNANANAFSNSNQINLNPFGVQNTILNNNIQGPMNRPRPNRVRF